MKKNRGSQFRKWDLHLHSCYSCLNNHYPSDENGNKNEEQFIKTIKSKGLSAIGLTNYFNFTDKDFELKEKLEANDITTFLNLELRLSNINKVGDFFDYHIIFDNTLNPQIIKNLLGELRANTGSANKSFNRLTRKEIENSASISFEKLQEILKKEEELNGRYLTGFLSRGHGSATSDHDPKNQTVYENICNQSDFVIHSSCDNPQTCTDKKCKHNNLDTDREFWLNHKKYRRPLLQSSDAHCLDTIGEKYSWIKADLTFEGLKKILFEPEDRICLEKNNPDIKSDYQVIDFIKLDDKNTIYLNPALNTVIGGRSNGKSTLTNSIAKKLGNDRFISVTENDNRGMHVFKKDITIGWRDGQEHLDLEFLPQDYMIQIAESTEKKNKLIQDIVKSDMVNFSKIEEYNDKKRISQKQIEDLLQDWINLKEKLSTLTKPEGDKKGIETQIEKVKKQITEQEKQSNFSEHDSIAYQTSNTSLQHHLNQQKLSEINIANLHTMISSEINLSVSLLTSDDALFNQKLKNCADLLQKEINISWKEKLEELIKEQQQNYEDNKQKAAEILDSPIFKKGQENIENNKTLKKLTEIHKEETHKLEELEKYESCKETIQSQINDIQNKILDQYSEFKKLREQLQKDFKVKANSVEIKLNFQPIKFENRINYLHGRNTANNDFISDFDKDSTCKINSIFNDLQLTYNQGKNDLNLVKDVFSQEWFSLNYILQYDGDSFDQMSQGKKAFVILTLLLEFSKDKKPVIIDQPEDSLDNRSIYNDLTNYLKNKKKERQIILVTHNPNIVVGADAENVIVANQHSENTPNPDNTQFYYVNGALENTVIKNESELFTLNQQGIREHVIEILEGGLEAFKKREKKYN